MNFFTVASKLALIVNGTHLSLPSPWDATRGFLCAWRVVRVRGVILLSGMAVPESHCVFLSLQERGINQPMKGHSAWLNCSPLLLMPLIGDVGLGGGGEGGLAEGEDGPAERAASMATSPPSMYTSA
jgi:hypothetical protein